MLGFIWRVRKWAKQHQAFESPEIASCWLPGGLFTGILAWSFAAKVFSGRIHAVHQMGIEEPLSLSLSLALSYSLSHTRTHTHTHTHTIYLAFSISKIHYWYINISITTKKEVESSAERFSKACPQLGLSCQSKPHGSTQPHPVSHTSKSSSPHVS